MRNYIVIDKINIPSADVLKTFVKGFRDDPRFPMQFTESVDGSKVLIQLQEKITLRQLPKELATTKLLNEDEADQLLHTAEWDAVAPAKSAERDLYLAVTGKDINATDTIVTIKDIDTVKLEDELTKLGVDTKTIEDFKTDVGGRQRDAENKTDADKLESDIIRL